MTEHPLRYALALAIAALMAGILATAVSFDGWHSEQAILMVFLNLPGSMVGVWVTHWLHVGDTGLYVVTFAVNSAFYCLLVAFVGQGYRRLRGSARR